MLGKSTPLYKEHGLFCSSLLRLQTGAARAPEHSPNASARSTLRSSSSTTSHRDRARQLVHEQIRQQVPEVLSYADFLVLDQKLALSIQPSVPIPHGYSAYWPFRPDARHVIDITLGVLLSDPKELEILGYVAMPRFLAGDQLVPLSSESSPRIDLFGRCDLGFLQQLLAN